MELLRFVFGLRKTPNDRSVEQEKVGMTLRMSTIFQKFQRALPRKYLRPSASFANILGESSSRILANSGFHLNSE